jgi:hypothetical protein
MSRPLLKVMADDLFSLPETQVFVLLDGASLPGLLPALAHHRPEHVCLYRGDLEPDLAEVAPYLAMVPRESEFLAWLASEAWGQNATVFGVSAASLAVLRRHFRGFLLVKTPEGKKVYFRFYDPRVLRVYLPTCTPTELRTVYGPVLQYAMEADPPDTMLTFTMGRKTPVRTPVSNTRRPA